MCVVSHRITSCRFHQLYTQLNEDTEVMFTVTGTLEFMNEDDSLKGTMDIFTSVQRFLSATFNRSDYFINSFAKLYSDYCISKGVKPNPKLWH
jgi:2,4'-dihydroxyacetophenone dioxygenase